MKIAITGATGFVGRNIVPILHESGADLLLVGRDPLRVSQTFPHIPACGYEDLDHRAATFDMLVHLAVVNNNQNVSSHTFHDVNVSQFLEVVAAAKRAGIARVVNISSIHALDSQNVSPYAQSKREALRRLADVKGIEITTVFLSAVYGYQWSGKLSVLNSLPKPLALWMFQFLAALKPVTHASLLADFLLSGADTGGKREVILSDGQGSNFVYQAVSRLIDLTFAAAIILVLWWGMILVWILVRCESTGPGIFVQQRVGRNGATFACYKFRTMYVGTAQAATNEISATSVTRLGRILRTTKLDELPQVWNILRNEVSLVGPRPCLPIQQKLIEARQNYGVLQLQHGITGLAQVNDIDMSDPERLAEWDARYLALQSLILDMKIIIRTAIGSGRGDRVSETA